MTFYTRIALIHLVNVMLLVACAVVLNVMAWLTTPDPFPDTLWNLVVMPGLRVLAGIGGGVLVLYGATSPVVWRLLSMHKRKTAP